MPPSLTQKVYELARDSVKTAPGLHLAYFTAELAVSYAARHLGVDPLIVLTLSPLFITTAGYRTEFFSRKHALVPPRSTEEGVGFLTRVLASYAGIAALPTLEKLV